jgi:hypothetical protein
VVGEHQRPGDLDVNVCKKKHLTNMRAASADIEVRLTPPRQMSLDDAIEYLAADELLEVTPQAFRRSLNGVTNLAAAQAVNCTARQLFTQRADYSIPAHRRKVTLDLQIAPSLI